MNGRTKKIAGTLIAIAAGAGLTACDDAATGPEGSGTATVGMNRLADGGQSAATLALAKDPRFASIELGDVSAILIEVDSVEAHRIGGGDGSGADTVPGGWYGVAVTLTEPLDLMTLSADGSVEIAEGSLPAGSYDQLRLFFTGATIDFAEGVDPDGDGPLAEGATDVELRIPSGAQTGVKVPGVEFEIVADDETPVTVSFDDETSVQNITITGSGEVLMSPVLTGDGGPPAGT